MTDPTTTTESSSSSSSIPNGILKALQRTVGTELYNEIRACKILLVGAGGIGCELLKNLALCGFWNCTVIDLDTIDVSNLNRQLLFRSHHVGSPKCTVACTVSTDLVQSTIELAGSDPLVVSTEIQYVAHHGNICDTSIFNVTFVQDHADIVLNALDNVVARRRVNRLCLAANIPLVEAGTTGYLGQVRTIHKGSRIACYECTTQETAKVYPICTIRSTPTAPVHTIVWSKELYKLLFHPKIEESMLYESIIGDDDNSNENNKDKTDNGNETETTTNEPSTYMDAVLEYRKLLEQKKQGEEVDVDAVRKIATSIIVNLYVDEIQKQLNMDRYKTSLKKPVPLTKEYVEEQVAVNATNGSSTEVVPMQRATYKQTDILSTSDNIIEFVACLQQAAIPTNPDEILLPSFDKDDPLAMRFVTVSSNLRNTIFAIEPLQSYYSAKGIAGNIVPAIASTNAIAAGLQILQLFQILKAKVELRNGTMNENAEEPKELDISSYCSYIDIHRNRTRNGLTISTSKLEGPNPNCFVCRNATVPIRLTVANWTLQDFLNTIIKKELGFQEPTLSLDGDIIWEEGDGADSDAFVQNLTKSLPKLPCGGIHNGTSISVEDFSQDLSVELIITNQETWEQSNETTEPEDTYHKFVVGGNKPVATIPTAAAVAAVDPPKADDAPTTTTEPTAVENNKIEEDDDDDDDIIIVVNNDKDSKKRSAEDNDDANDDDETKPPASKRIKTNNGESADEPVENVVIEIDDD